MTRPIQVHWAPKEHPFCGNPDCVLYVRAGDPGVIGSGNWAILPDRRVVGRNLYAGIFLCDCCGRKWRSQPMVETDGWDYTRAL